MDDLDQMLKQTFLEEAEQMLEGCEHCFLALEAADNRTPLIEQVFRLAHSFKGSAGAAGFEDLARFAHHFESLLLGVKQEKVAVTAKVVNLLLEANDALRSMVETLKHNLDARLDVESFIRKFDDAAIENAPNSGNGRAKNESSEAQTQLGFAIWDTAELTSAPAYQELAAPFAAAASTSEGAPASSEDANIRVKLERIDALINDVGELVILQSVLYQHRQEVAQPLLQKTIVELEKITRSIQDASMNLRMFPMRQTMQKLQRVVRDTSLALNKQVHFVMKGEDAEIDKTVLDVIADPLVHLVRNAVDHGIEVPEARLAAGKSAHGTVAVRAFQSGDSLAIEVEDNGRGLDAEALIKKARAQGLLNDKTTLSHEEALQLIFKPGLSTRDVVSEFSGRGVGMDVVKTYVERVKGRIELSSQIGQGSCIRILLPLTLAIIDGLVVTLGEDRYVIPLSTVRQSIRPTTTSTSTRAGLGELLDVRGSNVPLYRLPNLLGRSMPKRDAAQSIAILVEVGKALPAAVLVDDVLGRQQIVIKRLGAELRGQRGLSGAAILGDGKAALILDIDALVRSQQGVLAS